MAIDLGPRVVAVFVGTAQPLGVKDRSGIYKSPVETPVEIRWTGLAGDENVERGAGEQDQAVCAYPVEHYQWWRGVFDAASAGFGPGAFGENLSLAGIAEQEACIGDMYRVGTAMLQISKPRGPCRKVGQRHHIPELASAMRRSLRTGWYLRVLQVGTVQRGVAADLVERPSPQVTVHAAAEAMYLRPRDRELAELVAGCRELAQNWRDVLAARIDGRPEPPL